MTWTKQPQQPIDPAGFQPLIPFLTFEKLKEQAYPSRDAYYAVNTCWWGYDIYYTLTNSKYPLPCDPRGSVLMQGPRDKFIASAEANPSHYGKHGLLAFAAAFHGNLLTLSNKPTSFEGWDKYNEILDHWFSIGWKPE